MNGGFPPIKYINNKTKILSSSEKILKKDRHFSTIPNKHLDIKKILIHSNNPTMDINKDHTINIIETL